MPPGSHAVSLHALPKPDKALPRMWIIAGTALIAILGVVVGALAF